MSVFTKRNFQEKLVKDLANDVSKGKEIRMWILEHKIHFQAIVRIWFKELINASPVEKLAFLYLAYDVMWHSTKDCPQFVTEFGKYMKNVFEHLVTVDFDDRAMCVLGELVQKWRTWRIFDQDIQDKVEKIWGKFSDGVLVAKQVKKELSLIGNCPSHLMCSVCSGLLKEPVQLPCCKTALCKFCAFQKLERYKGCWFGFCPKSVLIHKEEVRISPELALQVENWKTLNMESEKVLDLEVENKDGFQVDASNAREYFETDIKCEKEYQRKSSTKIMVDDNKCSAVQKVQHVVILGLRQYASNEIIKKYCEKFGVVLQIQQKKANCGKLWGSAYISFTEKAAVDRIMLQKNNIDDNWCYTARVPESELKDLKWDNLTGENEKYRMDRTGSPVRESKKRGTQFDDKRLKKTSKISTNEGDNAKIPTLNQFVNICGSGTDGIIKFATESDGTLLLSSVRAHFPGTVGLKHWNPQLENGFFWSTRHRGGVLYPPTIDGWSGKVFVCIKPAGIIQNQEIVRKELLSNDESYSEIFVDQVTETLTSEDLRKYFETFGQVRDVYFSEPRKNFAFVRFSNQQVAMHLQVAMSLRGTKHHIKDANVRVGYCVSYGIDATRAKLHVQAERS